MEQKAEVNPNQEGWTPVHHAAAMGHNNILSLILSRQLSASSPLVNSCDSMGRTPLFLAAANGRITVTPYFPY